MENNNHVVYKFTVALIFILTFHCLTYFLKNQEFS